MKKLAATIIAIMVVLASFAQAIQPNQEKDPTRKNPPVVNKREKKATHKAPAGNKNYNKDATVRSKKDMNKQVAKFQDPKYGQVVNGSQKKTHAKTAKGD